jgi:hypothetical protein
VFNLQTFQHPAKRFPERLMSTLEHQPEFPPALRRVLDDVRRRIRTYLWIEGLALLVAVLGAAFWLGLAWDWLLEPSPGVRRIALAAVAVAALYVAYRYLLRRVFVPISDSSAAILLERRFPSLREHLLTSLDAASPKRTAAYDAELVSQTQRAAVEAVAGIKPSEVFNRGPLARAIAAAGLLVATVVLFAVLSRDVFGFWIQRIALSHEPWPRRVALEVVGFAPDEHGRRVHKLAQDEDFELMVRASSVGHEIPDAVEIRFRLADGRRGRDTMIRVGEAVAGRDEFQVFRYEFKHVAADMQFDVVGGDDRVRDLELRVVDRPELFAIELECEYPGYLEREVRRLPVTGGMRIPEGTRIVLHASATKPLNAASIRTTHDPRDIAIPFPKEPQKVLRWEYGTVVDDDVLLLDVTDTDNVKSREPYRVSITVVGDEVPQVAVRLAGIGSAITPEAILPVSGTITDDYGLDRAWFEYRIDLGETIDRPLLRMPAGEPVFTELEPFDTRAIDASTGKRALTLRPGQRLTLSLKAADRFDLWRKPPSNDATPTGSESNPQADAASQPDEAESPLHAGSSQQFTLDVVTVSELLALLERRELQLRQRYEAIYEKMTDMRNLLARVEFDESLASSNDNSTADREVADSNEPGADDGTGGDSSISAAAQRALARRRLRVAGSLQDVVQSADEITGVAEAFDDLHDELLNNRIDNPDLRRRLREQIARPLHQIADQRMPILAARLELVEDHLQDADGPPELVRAISLADEILVEMREVLDRMLELETYNEVVSQLRGIISDQQEISRQTKQRQRDRLRSLFEDEDE